MHKATVLAFTVCSLAAAIAHGVIYQCPQQTTCRTNGHYSYTANDYPYDEDVTTGSSTPVPDPFVVSSGSAWTQISGGCVSIGGLNLNGTQPFNALLRAFLQVQSTTAATGARYEVQLLV